ncbi:MAG: alginate lyase family protein [Burkholderiales bacterium]|nr:alginate lyase family protein [Nitrosomonas sp.]MCP5274536.1 alginate lyase family protein [Burkholderiales bacterium]
MSTVATEKTLNNAFWNMALETYSPQQRIDYFCRRKNVRFFPVLDDEMTNKAIIDAILDNRFDFNGERFQLPQPIDWLKNPSDDIEWQILLHKFYYAPGLGKIWQETGDSRYLLQWINLTDSWITQTPVDFIAPEVTGRRVQNWIYAWYYFVSTSKNRCIDAEFHDRFLYSLNQQVNYLCQHLAPARNHRTIALYSIFLASIVFPEMADAHHWREFSLHEIYQNVMQDLLEDGVQCELSTDYHHLVLRNYLAIRRLAKLNNIAIKADMDERLNRALDFAMYAHKPDGEVPSFSDGDVRSFHELLFQGAALYQREDLLYVATQGKKGIPPRNLHARFDNSGYYILRSGWGQSETAFQDERYFMLDCGPLGAGNHGHLDALSFEAAAFGRSLIVDPARYTYHENGEVNWRVKFRSTESHNTVLVDGKNQTRYVPGPARYKIKGPAPETRLHALIQKDNFVYLHGSAKSFEYDAVHHRQILFVNGEYWIIVDTLNGCSEHRYELLFHLSPHASQSFSQKTSNATCQVVYPNLVVATPFDNAQQLITENGFVSKRYGEKNAAPVLRFVKHARRTVFVTVLYPFKNNAPDLQISVLKRYGSASNQAGFNHPATTGLVIKTAFQAQATNGLIDSCFCPAPEHGDAIKGSWTRNVKLKRGDN